MTEHRHRTWFWTTCLTPTNPPFAMTGWWSRCTCCPEATAHYQFNALATEQGRRWWERVFPVRFGESPVRVSWRERVQRWLRAA